MGAGAGAAALGAGARADGADEGFWGLAAWGVAVGVWVDEQATISTSVQTTSSPAHHERAVKGRWSTGVWGMEWVGYTGNTPQRKDGGVGIVDMPNKRPPQWGKVV